MSTTDHPPFLVERNPGYFEYQLPVSVKLIIDYGGKVPLLKNEREEWELPGGKLEVGERPDECVAREVEEELGLTVKVEDLVDTWVYEITPLRHVFIVTYGAHYTGFQTPRSSNEHKALGLFSPGEVGGLTMPEQYKTSIKRWYAMTGKPTA
ncbi:mutator mutT protein [Thermomonospora echinospora]|uniref:Mutator mutT protein n=1 Tax=Thermomonospora echinospora TaxID=1992 RepID=A0A1H6CAL7_9ACTN|nr:NUDIX hydrolase [Thermomonospora echinospora]SEG70001.1 mutator mutT protein [Thermomonospora echinospora]